MTKIEYDENNNPIQAEEESPCVSELPMSDDEIESTADAGELPLSEDEANDNAPPQQAAARRQNPAISREEMEKISMEFLSLGSVRSMKARKLGRKVYSTHVDQITPRRKKFFGGKYDQHKMVTL